MASKYILAGFWRNTRGGIALTFGLAAALIAVICLGTIDYSRASRMKNDMQDALDAAALIAARSDAADETQINKVGTDAFNELIKTSDAKVIDVKFTLAQDKTITATAHGMVDAIFLGVMKDGKMRASASSQVKWAQGTPVELVLTLDTTGSMAGQKLIDLKDAAKGLVTQLSVGGDKPNLKIGVVPFAQYVNIGVTRRSLPWAAVPADYSQVVTPACTTTTSKTTCQSQAYSCTQYNDGVAYQTTCYKSVNCVTTPVNPPVKTCPAPYTNNYKFSGCIGSPAYPKNVEDKDATRQYPGFLNLGCGVEILPLTSKMSSVTSVINSLSASGETYIPAGLDWGYNMLSNPQPLTDAAPYDKAGKNRDPRKVLVLMTDGANTKLMNHANGRHDQSPPGNSPAKEAVDYTQELCKNIKADHIEVYTVSFQVNDPQAQKLMDDCATDASHAFAAADRANLIKAFSQIASNLLNLYIAK